MSTGMSGGSAYGEEHAALLVLTEMLDREVGAVREQLGASYGVYASLRVDPGGVLITGAIDSERAGQGLRAILAGVQRVRDGEGFDQRFALARRQVLRTLVDDQGDASRLTGYLTAALAGGQAADYFQQLGRRVATLAPDDVHAVAERVLPVERSVMLVQGPAAGVADALEGSGITEALALPEVVHQPAAP
jgi:predicted Zn-dependent peptidase